MISELLRIDHRTSTEIEELRTALQGQESLPLWQHEMLSGVRMAMIAIIPEQVGLPDIIHGSVVASKPKTMQEPIEIETELMDKKIRTFAKRETASKRKFE
nr:hypothetical protein [Tanacetum cinerariifolium]